MSFAWFRAASVLAAGVLTAACSFDESGLGPGDGGPGQPDAFTNSVDARADVDAVASTDAMADIDATPGAPDAMPAADAPPPPDAPECPGDVITAPISNFDSCDIPPGTTTFEIADASMNDVGTLVLDTDDETITEDGTTTPLADTHVVTQTNAPDILVVAYDSFSLGAFNVMTVEGSRALAIVSYGDITIDGWLNAGADLDQPGPGGNHEGACGSGVGANGTEQTDDDDNEGGSGGGGGGYGSDGGRGAEVAESGGDRTAGGDANGSTQIAPLRGGCPGGNGGNDGAAGGGGGGALQLVADGTVDIGGWVSTRGGGGLGATAPSSGVGGGGSGGAILIQAGDDLVTGDAAFVTSHGGGGGEGRGGGGTGNPGDNGYTNSTDGASGGSSGTFTGGNGGDGAADPNAQDGSTGSATENAAGGGGGGGGGVGRIHFDVVGNIIQSGTSTISPGP